MKFSIKHGLALLAFNLSLSITTPLVAQSAKTHIRAAIDIGSGGPKLRIAEIDSTTNKIIKLLQVKQYPVIFQESLSQGSDKTLSPTIIEQGIQAIKEAIFLAKSCDAEGIVMIGTSVFRNAVNGKQFANVIQRETHLPVHVLDQKLEGILAFQAALAQTNTSKEDLIVWDIGGGSTQFIGINNGSFLVYESSEGSGRFRDFIITSIQNKNIQEWKSPNPISQREAGTAKAHAAILSKRVDQIFKDKLQKPATTVVGVGSVFGRGIASLLQGKNSFTNEDLAAVVDKLMGKSDADLGGGVFACIEVSNALLALGFMEGLGIKQMSLIDVNNADGALVYKPFWE